METLSNGEEKVTRGRSGGRNHNTQVAESPSSRENYCFPEANSNIHYHSPEKRHNWWLQAKQLAFLNAYCAIPPSFPKSLFSPYLNSHTIFHSTVCAHYWMPWANMIQHKQWTLLNMVHLKTSADTASCVITVILHVLLQEGHIESSKLIKCLQTAVKQDWPVCHWKA